MDDTGSDLAAQSGTGRCMGSVPTDARGIFSDQDAKI